jgi:hypothetical protein
LLNISKSPKKNPFDEGFPVSQDLPSAILALKIVSSVLK